jgi:hypothetical protein
MPTNNESLNKKVGAPGPQGGPGYEMTDVNVNGVVVFLGGLVGFLAVFFIFCFFMGKVINTEFAKADGPRDKWHSFDAFAGAAANKNHERKDLESNAVIEQHELDQVTKSFPSPRLDTDDGNQATADLHAKEDLLLDHYSKTPEDPGHIRIPIDRAMELIAERGLPVNAAGTPSTLMAGDQKPVVQVPLTTGFARTGYELDVIEARKQKMSYGEAEAPKHAELAPLK